MSLSAILEAICSTGEAQIVEIEKDVENQVHLIQAETQAAARELHEQACASILLPAYHERARILQNGRLEALRIAGDVREALIDAALSQAGGRLASFRNNPAYPHVFQQLVHQALAELQASLDTTGKIELQADMRDRDILEAILQKTETDLIVGYDLKCWGGVVAKSQDGGVLVINTLEARLERATLYLRRCLSAEFESQSLASRGYPGRMPKNIHG
jgi:vacuolar-type H+-ATPase subunit E/Vma4